MKESTGWGPSMPETTANQDYKPLSTQTNATCSAMDNTQQIKLNARCPACGYCPYCGRHAPSTPYSSSYYPVTYYTPSTVIPKW